MPADAVASTKWCPDDVDVIDLKIISLNIFKFTKIRFETL